MNRDRAVGSFEDGIAVIFRALRSVGIDGAVARELAPVIIRAARREPDAEAHIARVYQANAVVRSAWPAMRRVLGLT